MNPILPLLVLSLSFAFARDSGAGEIWRRGEAQLDFSGSLREIALATRQTDRDDFLAAIVANSCFAAIGFEDCPAFDERGERRVGQSLTRLRTRFDLQATQRLSAVLAYDHEVLAGRIDTLETSLGDSFASDGFLGAEGDLVTRDSVRWRHLLYRGTIQFEGEHLEWVIGRQRIAWGVARLWNPIDRFNSIPPLATEADQSAGVDGVDLKWIIDGFHFVEAVYTPGKSRDEARYALRLHGVFLDTDLSLLGGVFERAPTAGFDLSRNLADAALNIEVVYTDPEQEIWPIGAAAPREPEPFWQVVVSLDRNFDLGTGVYLLVEHLYNGNALGFGKGRAGSLINFFETTSGFPSVTVASPNVFGSSRVISAARHQSALQLGYDLTPELRFDLLTILDWNGKSAAWAPFLRYSPLDWLEISVGAQFFAGPRLSEYGQVENLYYLITELFF